MTQQINLIDQTLRQGRDWANGVMVLSVLTLSTLAVAGHWAWERWQWQQALDQVSQADAAKEASSAALQQVTAQLTQLQAQVAADDQMRRAAAAMVDPPQNCVQRFEGLVAALSPSMWLQNVEFAGARGVHLVVSGLHQADLARYADGLSSTAAFAGLPIEILRVERETLSGGETTDTGEVNQKKVPYYTFELSGTDKVAPKEGTP